MASNPVSINLRPNESMYLTMYGSSANMEKIVLKDPSSNNVISHSGTSGADSSDDVLLHAQFTTVAATGGAPFVTYSLDIKNSSDGGTTYVDSQVTDSHEYSFATYHLRVVTAGDTNDNNYDDCVVQINWFTEQDPNN